MVAGEVNDLVSSFKTVSVKDVSNDAEVIPILERLIASAEQNASSFTPIELTSEFLQLLTKTDSILLREQIDRSIAELTKIEEQRKRFTNTAIIDELLKHLAITSTNIDVTVEHLKLITQACRALGNICYENENARNIILNLKGDEQLIKLLHIKLNEKMDVDMNFSKARTGLISNYLLGGEHLSKHFIELNILDKIEKIINNCLENVENNEIMLLTTLQPLSLLTENVSDLNFPTTLNTLLGKILTMSKHPDIAEICLEMLNYQAENDEVKSHLAKEGLCEIIYNLVETYKTLAKTSEARALMKLACDLIVLILTGDESMAYLYKSPLLKNMENWLDSDDIDLQTTGVLALGNFARTDSHCIEMVDGNITAKLLEILSKNNGIDNEMRLQHALLSALRNLVIPKQNKSIIIKAGLVQTILPMLEIHQAPVVYKLLGTLRMMIDGQMQLAHELLQNIKLIEQLVQWSQSSECTSVTGESYRLMAWLIKHAYRDSNTSPTTTQQPTKPTHFAADQKSLKKFVQIDGAVASMVTMLTSQHLVMQNEALIALCIISSIFIKSSDVNLSKIFIECDIGGKINEFITKNSDTMTKEIVENVQSLINILKTSEILVSHLNERNIDEILTNVPKLTEICTL